MRGFAEGPIRRRARVGAAALLAVAALCGPAALARNASTAAAGTWHKVATEPYRLNNKQDAITFADPRVGLYGNGTGRIYRTEDGGAHWRLAWRKAGTYVRTLEFADARTAFMGNVGPGYFDDVTDRQPLYVTHDAGTTWTPVTGWSGPPVAGLCALDILKQDGKLVAIRAGGRVGGPAALLESFDGGATWRSRDMSAVTGMILDIHFVDARTGFIAGASQSDEGKAHARILKTTDGGETWRAVFDSPRAGDNNWKLAFPSPAVGYATIMSYEAPAAEARGYVVKTEDGGEHWRPLTVTHEHGWVPYGIAFVSADRGWVGGSTGGYETTDGGTHWHAVPMGLSTNKMRVLPRPDGGHTVFALGHDLYRLDLPASP